MHKKLCKINILKNCIYNDNVNEKLANVKILVLFKYDKVFGIFLFLRH